MGLWRSVGLKKRRPDEMLKPSASGVLYIIGERSHLGAPTGLYKIGIVRENEKARSVDERLREHQTGNPRELFVTHSELTPLVERLETLLHGQYASKRIGGEWFELPDRDLDDVIATAAKHISDAREVSPILNRAIELAGTQSNGAIATPDAEHQLLHEQLLAVRAQITASTVALKHLVTELLAAQEARQPARPWVQVEHKASRRTFDGTAFEAAHPTIYERYLIEQETFKKTFRVTALKGAKADLSELNPSLADTIRLAKDLRAATSEGDIIHSTYLRVLAIQAPLIWRDELLEARLRVACGEYDAVSGVCTWKRETVTRLGFDSDTFKNEHPDLYEQFFQVGQPTISHIPTKDRNYRL